MAESVDFWIFLVYVHPFLFYHAGDKVTGTRFRLDFIAKTLFQCRLCRVDTTSHRRTDLSLFGQAEHPLGVVPVLLFFPAQSGEDA